MLNHLPDSRKQLLHAFYQTFWLNETLPSIWKQSVIIPILKQGKPKSAIDGKAHTQTIATLLWKKKA